MQLFLLKLESSAPFSGLHSRTVENQLKNSKRRETKTAKDSNKPYYKGQEFSGLKRRQRAGRGVHLHQEERETLLSMCTSRVGVRKLPACQTS